LARLWHPSKFQPASRLGFVTAATSSTEVNQTLHDDWPSPGLAHYINILGGCCHLTEFYHVQNSLCVQVLRSPILSALMHGTRAAGSAKLCGVWYKQLNYGTLADGATYIQLGGHHVGHRPIFLVNFTTTLHYYNTIFYEWSSKLVM